MYIYIQRTSDYTREYSSTHEWSAWIPVVHYNEQSAMNHLSLFIYTPLKPQNNELYNGGESNNLTNTSIVVNYRHHKKGFE